MRHSLVSRLILSYTNLKNRINATAPLVLAVNFQQTNVYMGTFSVSSQGIFLHHFAICDLDTRQQDANHLQPMSSKCAIVSVPDSAILKTTVQMSSFLSVYEMESFVLMELSKLCSAPDLTPSANELSDTSNLKSLAWCHDYRIISHCPDQAHYDVEILATPAQVIDRQLAWLKKRAITSHVIEPQTLAIARFREYFNLSDDDPMQLLEKAIQHSQHPLYISADIEALYVKDQRLTLTAEALLTICGLALRI